MFKRFTLAALAVLVLVVAYSVPARTQNPSLLFGSFNGLAKAIAVDTNGNLKAVIQGGSGGTFTTLSMGTGSPTTNIPFSAQFTVNGQLQHAWQNASDGVSAYAEYLVKSGTTNATSVYFGAEGDGSSDAFGKDRGYLISNPTTNTNTPGFDLTACSAASPAGCTVRFVTNSAVLAGVRASIAASGAVINNSLTLGFSTDGTATTDTGLSRVSAGVVGVGTGGAGSFAGTLKTTNMFVAGTATTYNNQTTAGLGLSAILASSGISASKSANFTSLAYTPAAAAGVYKVYAVITSTSGTNTGTVQVTLDYTDSQGTAHSGDIVFLCGANAACAATQTGSSKEWHTQPWEFSINSAAAAINVKAVISGTVAYTIASSIERVQ